MNENNNDALILEAEQSILQLIRNNISRYGYDIILHNLDPSIAYTAGLTETLKVPELLIFGAPLGDATIILYDTIKYIETYGALSPAQQYPDTMQLADFIPIEACQTEARRYCYFTCRLYPSANFIQLVCPDLAGRFPWEAEFDNYLSPDQPLLGTIPDRSALH